MSNYSPLEFPVFGYDQDYMDILSKLVQEKIIKFHNSFRKIDDIFENYSKSLIIKKKNEGKRNVY